MAISDYKAALVQGWGSSKGILLRIELLVLFFAVLFAFTFVGGLYRRCSRSTLLKVLLWLANTLIYTVVAYTLGLIQSFPYRNEHFAVWTAFLFLVFLSSDSFLAYSLEDNRQWKTYFAHSGLVAIFVGFILGSAAKEFIGPLVFVYIHVALKAGERIGAAKLATQKYALPEDDKVVSDYMEHEVGSEGWLDPADMTGCPYLVNVGRVTLGAPDYRWIIDRASPKFVTVGKIWQCNGKVLQGERVKDVCLSF